MKKKGSKQKAAKPAPARREGKKASRAGNPGRSSTPVEQQYKVVELSTVDEVSLENALNEWVRTGWRLEGIHFAMRDSSKRPAMAFLLFTRPVEAQVTSDSPAKGADRSVLHPVSESASPSADPWRRLRQLAGVEAAEPEPGRPSPGKRAL